MPFGRTPRMTIMAAATLATALTITSCTAQKGGRTVTVTVPPSSPATPGSSSSASNTVSGTATGSAPTSPAATALPGTCDSLLSPYYVEQALNNVQLAGATAFVVGVPDPTIGRLSTINCRYGVTGTGAAAASKVEIGVSLYATAAQAQARVSATAADYTSRGATATSVTVPASGAATAVGGTYLSGAAGTGYTLPLLVLAEGNRTVAVTVDPAAVPSPPAPQGALAVARVVLTRTAG